MGDQPARATIAQVYDAALGGTDNGRRGRLACRAAADTPAVTRGRTTIAGLTPNPGSCPSAMGMQPSGDRAR